VPSWCCSLKVSSGMLEMHNIQLNGAGMDADGPGQSCCPVPDADIDSTSQARHHSGKRMCKVRSLHLQLSCIGIMQMLRDIVVL
jgi:hypothetical protein